MIQLIGLIIAIYAVARLLQVPIEHMTSDNRRTLLWIIAVPAIGVILLLTAVLLFSGAMPPGLG